MPKGSSRRKKGDGINLGKKQWPFREGGDRKAENNIKRRGGVPTREERERQKDLNHTRSFLGNRVVDVSIPKR